MHGYNDVWIEGARYREIYQSEELLKKKKEELDQERKKVMKERASRRGVNLSEDARRREAIQVWEAAFYYINVNLDKNKIYEAKLN